ncbi:hypothetical protein Emin_0530 [Elusimicrobium minutum Pei191]|uniref:Late embryogenesis abundant protein LEA-2 subgroup domain-containing protein n=1 Tax=Elusimicrobium minutum (strain Pei191) TaxID=445932 RepID=B2KCG4_ELUMP|nr:LEA type 2 family protein [Elusimicrobium minutum]ACC98085.1 hypothetical protein Emin_0530 [Elusimicrobium minutum Pei191]
MNKKLVILISLLIFSFACTGLQENYNMVKCKYDLVKVEPADFNINTISMNVAISIQNTSRTTAAAIKRFDGNFYVNDNSVSEIVFKDVRVEPGETKTAKSTLEIPINKLGKTLTGLVSMGSVSVDYQVRGTMYFETPLGDIPFPVTIYQSKKF